MKQSTGRYIDPLTDWGFKRLFGSEPNKDILKDFLNDLFAGEKCITDVNYSPNEHGGVQKKSKKAIFDLYCTGDQGEQFIVEMQRGKQAFFRERSVFYTSRLIQELLPEGRESNTFDLPEVYLIAILEFTMMEDSPEQYLHDVCLIDKDTGAIFYKKLGYKFLVLPNFMKAEDELQTDLDRWFYLLKNMSRLEKMPLYFDKRIFQKVFQIAEVSKLTKEERMLYDRSLQEKWDYENVLAYAVNEAGEKKYAEGKQEGIKEGIKEGIREGKQEGIKEGKQEGIKEGKQEGIKEGILETARKMKSIGISIEDISKSTGLCISEIEEL